MRYLKYAALLGVLLFAARTAHAQVSVGVGIGPVYGPAPSCAYGYYGYYPYACAPYGYYGPDWFVGGVFIGAGPWYHGFYGPRFYGRGYYGRGYYGHGYYGRSSYGYYGRGYGYGYMGMATGRAMAIGRYMAAAIAELRDAAMRVAATMAMLPAVSMLVAACTAVVATDKQRSLAGARG